MQTLTRLHTHEWTEQNYLSFSLSLLDWHQQACQLEHPPLDNLSIAGLQSEKQCNKSGSTINRCTNIYCSYQSSRKNSYLIVITIFIHK